MITNKFISENGSIDDGLVLLNPSAIDIKSNNIPHIINITQTTLNITPDGVNNIAGTAGDSYVQYSFELPDDIKLLESAKATAYDSKRPIASNSSKNFSALKTSLYSMTNGSITKQSLFDNFFIIKLPLADNSSKDYNMYTIVPLLYVNGVKIRQNAIGIFRINMTGEAYILLDKSDSNISRLNLTNNANITVRIKYKEYTTNVMYNNDSYNDYFTHRSGNVVQDTFNGSFNYRTDANTNDKHGDSKPLYGTILSPIPYDITNGNNITEFAENAIIDKTLTAFDTFNKLRFDDDISIYIEENGTYYEVNSTFFSMMYTIYNDISKITSDTNDFNLINKTNNDYIRRYKHLLLSSQYSDVNHTSNTVEDPYKITNNSNNLNFALQRFTMYNYIWLVADTLSKIRYVNKKAYPQYVVADVNNISKNLTGNTVLLDKIFIFKPTDITLYDYNTGVLLIPGVDYKFNKYNDNNDSYRYSIVMVNQNVSKVELIPEYSTSVPYLLNYRVSTSSNGSYIYDLNRDLFNRHLLMYKINARSYDNYDVFINGKLVKTQWTTNGSSDTGNGIFGYIKFPASTDDNNITIYTYLTLDVVDRKKNTTNGCFIGDNRPTTISEINTYLNVDNSSYNKTYDFIGSKYKIITDPSVISYYDSDSSTDIFATSYVPYKRDNYDILVDDEMIFNNTDNFHYTYVKNGSGDNIDNNIKTIAQSLKEDYNNAVDDINANNDLYNAFIDSVNSRFSTIDNKANKIYENMLIFAINSYFEDENIFESIKLKNQSNISINLPFRRYTINTSISENKIDNLHTYSSIYLQGYTNTTIKYISNTLTNSLDYTKVHNHLFTVNTSRLPSATNGVCDNISRIDLSLNWTDTFILSDTVSNMTQLYELVDEVHSDDEQSVIYPENIMLSLDLLTINPSESHQIHMNADYCFNDNESLKMRNMTAIISHKYNSCTGYLIRTLANVAPNEIVYIQTPGVIPEKINTISTIEDEYRYTYILMPESECIVYYYNDRYYTNDSNAKKIQIYPIL